MLGPSEQQPVPSHPQGFLKWFGLALHTPVMFAPVAKTGRNNCGCVASPGVKTSIRPHWKDEYQ